MADRTGVAFIVNINDTVKKKGSIIFLVPSYLCYVHARDRQFGFCYCLN